VADGRLPENFAIGGRQASHGLTTAATPRRVDSLAYNGDASEAFTASLGAPNELGLLLGPVLQQSRVGRESITVGSAPLWPLRRGGLRMARGGIGAASCCTGHQKRAGKEGER